MDEISPQNVARHISYHKFNVTSFHFNSLWTQLNAVRMPLFQLVYCFVLRVPVSVPLPVPLVLRANSHAHLPIECH